MLSWLILGVLLAAFLLCTYYLIRIFLKRPLSYLDKVLILVIDLAAIVGIFLALFFWLIR